MAHEITKEDTQNFYLYTLCPLADFIKRLCFVMTLDEKKSQDLLNSAFKKWWLLKHDELLEEDALNFIIKNCFDNHKESTKQNINNLNSCIKNLEEDERLAFLCIDVLGQEEEKFLHWSSWEQKKLNTALKKSREKVTNDSLNQKSTFEVSLGHLQIDLQKIMTNSEEMQNLHDLVESKKDADLGERNKIDEIEKMVDAANIKRRIILSIICLISFVVLYMMFAPQSKPEFQNSLDSISYEAIALIEDRHLNRLALPSFSKPEIAAYLRESKELGFRARVLNLDSDSAWLPEGASIIDYEVAKISVVGYGNKLNKHKIFFFNYAGNLSDLKKSKLIKENNFSYQAYASDHVNMIAWQDDEQTLGVLAGQVSISHLSSIIANEE